MARSRQVPTLDQILVRFEKRIAALEHRLTKVIDERRTPLWFSISGACADSVGLETGPMRFVYPTEILLAVPQVLVAPGGADITIDLTAYGPITGVVKTLTIPDGILYAEDAVAFVMPAGSALTAMITAADGGTASELAIALTPTLL